MPAACYAFTLRAQATLGRKLCLLRPLRVDKQLRYIFLFSLVAVACGTENKSREPLVPQKEYTRENPAEWSQLTESHLPVGILDSQNREIASQKLSHERLQNIVRVFFTTDLSNTGLKAFARCSQHDLWTNPFPKVTSEREESRRHTLSEDT